MQEAGTLYPRWLGELAFPPRRPPHIDACCYDAAAELGERLFPRHDAIDGWGYSKPDALTTAGYVRGGGGKLRGRLRPGRGDLGGVGAPHSSLSPVPVPVPVPAACPRPLDTALYLLPRGWDSGPSQVITWPCCVCSPEFGTRDYLPIGLARTSIRPTVHLDSVPFDHPQIIMPSNSNAPK